MFQKSVGSRRELVTNSINTARLRRDATSASAVCRLLGLISVFTEYIRLFIADNCRLCVGQVVIRDELVIRNLSYAS